MDSQKLKKLEEKIGLRFKDKNLFLEALTHRSYLNENPEWPTPHNERLEFLGDAVLELAVTEELFNLFPEEDEGKLTSLRAALVNYQILSRIAAESIQLEDFVLLSRGEAKDTGRARDVILANAIESLLGAIYLDAGYVASKGFVKAFVMNRLEEVIKTEAYKDPKSSLQEIAQAEQKVTPVYKIMEERGPDHAKVFVSGVYLGEKLVATGEGASKQDAEVEAARKALAEIRK